MNKKIISFILALVMCAGIVAGGGSMPVVEAANTTSIYELLPTAQYGSFMDRRGLWGNSSTLSYNEGRDFLQLRSWALRLNQTVKPMFDQGREFQENLRTSGQHIADTVNSIFYLGFGIDTPDRAVYVPFLEGRHHYTLSHFVIADGDGTVTTQSVTLNLQIPEDYILRVMVWDNYTSHAPHTLMIVTKR